MSENQLDLRKHEIRRSCVRVEACCANCPGLRRVRQGHPIQFRSISWSGDRFLGGYRPRRAGFQERETLALLRDDLEAHDSVGVIEFSEHPMVLALVNACRCLLR